LSAARLLRIAQDDDFAGAGVGQKNIPVGGDREPARDLEVFRKDIDLKARGNGGKKTRRGLHSTWSIARGFGGIRRREIGLLAVGHLRKRKERERKSDSQKKKDSSTHQNGLSRRVVNDWVSMMHQTEAQFHLGERTGRGQERGATRPHPTHGELHLIAGRVE
jgi:hypothetical protein